MFCINCGATLPAGSTFCTECGSALVSEGTAPGAKPEAEEMADEITEEQVEEAPAPSFDEADDIEQIQTVPEAMEDISSSSEPRHAEDTEDDALPQLAPENGGYTPPEEVFTPRPGYDDNFVYVEDYEASRPKRTKRWIFILVPIVLAVAGVAIAIAMWSNSPMQQLDRALASGDYSAVTVAINGLSADEQREASSRIISYAQAAVERYNQGEAEYDAAYELVDRVHRLFPSAGLDTVLSELEALKASKESFAAGAAAEETGDLETALARFGAVVESDASYEDAQARIDAIRTSYKNEALKRAEALENEMNFQGAIAALNETTGILGDDADIQARIEEIQNAETDAYVNDALENAAKLADGGDYPAALILLADSEKSDDERIQKQISDYRAAFKAQEMDRAAELANAGSYQEAVAVLETLAETLTGDAEITAKIDEYEALYPVSLLNLSPVAGDDLASSWTATDAAGNSYTGGLSFSLYPTAMSATTSYAANGGYTLLSGTWIVESDSDADFLGSVRIYVDETLVYEVNSLTVNSAPLDLNLRIADAQTVRIEASASFESPRSSGYIFLAGPMFRN